jgi:hypothetical protein
MEFMSINHLFFTASPTPGGGLNFVPLLSDNYGKPLPSNVKYNI